MPRSKLLVFEQSFRGSMRWCRVNVLAAPLNTTSPLLWSHSGSLQEQSRPLVSDPTGTVAWLEVSPESALINVNTSCLASLGHKVPLSHQISGISGRQ